MSNGYFTKIKMHEPRNSCIVPEMVNDTAASYVLMVAKYVEKLLLRKVVYISVVLIRIQTCRKWSRIRTADLRSWVLR